MCKDYDLISGACITCFQGYSILNNDCVVSTLINQDKNCKTYDSNNICTSCYQGFYVMNSKCQANNPLCKTFNISNGFCLSCYPGYT